MPHAFAYLRVSTTGQTTDNQLQEIAAAGFKVEPRRAVTETVSGNVATSLRRGFTRLLDRLEPSDMLVQSGWPSSLERVAFIDSARHPRRRLLRPGNSKG
jgi:hypothetical protein